LNRINFTVLIIGLVIVLGVALGFYIGFYSKRFIYFEEMKAFKIFNIIFIPLLLFLFLNATFSRFKKFKRSRDSKGWLFFKSTFINLVIYFGIYLYILRPVVIGLMFFINENLGSQTSTIISGTVIDKVNKPPGGRTPAIYRLVIRSGTNNIFNFETTEDEIEKYVINDTFKESVNRGSLGLYYSTK
jgi:hypothetical protein